MNNIKPPLYIQSARKKKKVVQNMYFSASYQDFLQSSGSYYMILTSDFEDWNKQFYETIDNQKRGLETQAKFLILLTPHP